MSFILGPSRAYPADIELFIRLGLKPFSVDSRDEFFVGEYKLPNYEEERVSVKIFVTCLPAQFWRFEVQTADNEKYEIKTGSGKLIDYWPSVLLVAEGCFCAEKK